MKRHFAKTSIVAAAVASAIALSTAAQASVYYQASFDRHDYSVDALFAIGSTCLPASTSGWVFANIYAAPSQPCSVSLVSAVATVVAGGPPGPNPVETIHIPFVSESNPNPYPNIITAVFDNFGEPTGIAWLPEPLGYIGPQSTSGNLNDSLNGTWWLSFFNDNVLAPPPQTSTAYLYRGETCVSFLGWQKCRPARVPGGGAPTIVNDLAPTGLRAFGNERPTNGTPVPEPGSLALAAVALGAGWLTRRRKAA